MAILKKTRIAAPTWPGWINRLASVQLTLISIGLAMILLTWGTLAQVHLGTFEAQKMFFDSWWVFLHMKGWNIPVFPGGLLVGALWLAGLIASFITRFRLSRKDIGIFISHAGLIFLLLGQLLTQWLARESQMPVRVGESKNYSEDFRHAELAIIKTSDPQFDTVTSIPESVLSKKKTLSIPRLPFQIVVHQFFRNANLAMASPNTPTLATQGIGTRIAVQGIPPEPNDAPNNTSSLIELVEAGKSLGIWLVSTGLEAPQTVTSGNATYRLVVRPKRLYFPFTLSLKEFHHDIYAGTDIPKNFSSLVELSNPFKNELRDVLIYMNHPLRYEGKTFYQASFGDGDKVSIFQVVENPFFTTPYIGCAIVILGLLIQFLSHLFQFVRRHS